MQNKNKKVKKTKEDYKKYNNRLQKTKRRESYNRKSNMN